MKKNILIATTLALAGLPGLWANTAPTVVIHSAAMRPGTTLMDIVFRVNDPDDATVKTRALAFKDGNRSFDSVIRPTTFVEGTGSKIGDAIPANVNHTITWDVAADWDVQLGQVKFEVLAMDGRGLLPLEWVTIPETNHSPELTISKNIQNEEDVLDAFLWLFAAGDPDIEIIGEYPEVYVRGNDSSGIFSQIPLVFRKDEEPLATPFLLKKMDLNTAKSNDLKIAKKARIIFENDYFAIKSNYSGFDIISAWGSDQHASGVLQVPHRLHGIKKISVSYLNSAALLNDGRIEIWGNDNFHGVKNIPENLYDIKDFEFGVYHILAVNGDGSVVGWGYNGSGQTNIPTGLTDVVQVDGGAEHSIALKSDGTVVGWGLNAHNQVAIPNNLNQVTKIAAGAYHSLALKSDGSVVGWGSNWHGESTIPQGLNDVISIAAGFSRSMALKRDGTVVCWGNNPDVWSDIPSDLKEVTAIAAGEALNIAVKSDGTVVAWGADTAARYITPNLKNVRSVATSGHHSIAIIQE